MRSNQAFHRPCGLRLSPTLILIHAALATAFLLTTPSGLNAASGTWTQLAPATYDWNNNANWSAAFPNGTDETAGLNVNNTGIININLNQAITIGTLNLGDTGATYFAQNIAPNGGSLSFDVSAGSAAINKTTAANNATDTISAPITLLDNLTVQNTAGGVLEISGAIGESGGAKSLTKTGNGNLRLTTNSTYTGQTTISAGTLQLGNNSAGGWIGSSITGGGLTGTGGTLLHTLTSSNTIASPTSLSATALSLTNGKLVLAGANTGTMGGITVNNGANNVNGWLEIASGASYTASGLGVGNGNGSVMHMTGGQLTTTGGMGVGGVFGTTVRYYQSDGTLNVGGSVNVGADGGNNDRAGIAVMSGGTFTVTGAMTLGPARNGTGHLYLKDATTTVNGVGGITLGSISAAGGGTGLIFLSETATLQTRQVQRSTLANPGFGESTMYFNGGTLVALANNTNFLGPLLTPAAGNTAIGSVTENMVRVYALGATIDTNTFDVTVNPALLSHTSTASNGIASATLANVGSGYSHPPNISFSGGGGAGATAIASVGANGAIDAIIITNPGAGYTSTPTINLSGGILIPGGVAANNTGATVSMVAANAGGLTKKSSGILTLARGTSSYTGPTRVQGGTLSIDVLANGGSLSSIGAASNIADNIVLSGGTLRYTGTGHSTDRLFSVGTSNGTLEANGSGAINFTNTGAMAFNSQTGARLLTLTGTNTGANTIAAVIGDNSGATSLTKNGAGQWILSGNNTYSGNTTVNLGTLGLSNSNNNNISSSPLISLATGTFLDTTALGAGPLTALDLILASGQTLRGTGTVVGNLTVAANSTIAPGNSPGTINQVGIQTWAPNGNMEVELNDATGTSGSDPGWDLLSITGSLDLSGLSAGNEFDIELVSLTLGNVGGLAVNFNQATTYAWRIVDTSNVISTYTGSNQFTVDSTAFVNPFTGSFSVLRGDDPSVTAVVVGANNTELYLYYTDQVAPVPEPATLALAALGLAGLGFVGFRRRQRVQAVR